jgi:hypothetical protein
MALLIFHLVLSSFTFDCIDISVAAKVLKWNLKRYPNGSPVVVPSPYPYLTEISGVFFLFGAGRLALCQSQPKLAVHYYTKAMESQTQYRNLHHISFWEIAIANLALWDIPASLDSWTHLKAEATVSKVVSTRISADIEICAVVESYLCLWNGCLSVGNR